jgi:hypothetical protein
MIRKLMRRLHACVDLRSDRRYCDAHRQRCPSAGGGYFIVSAFRRNWLCADALAKKAKRA